jgi:hypothetical protein
MPGYHVACSRGPVLCDLHTASSPWTLAVLRQAQRRSRLSGRESLGDDALERELLLLEVLGGGVLNLELSHGVGESSLDLLLLATLEADGGGRVGDHLLNAGDVRLKLLPALELLGESLVGALELGGVVDHVLDVGGRELADGVGDGDVGTAAGGLLGGGDLQDTVDVDLEDDLKDGITSLHGGNRSKGELSEGGVVLAVDTLTLEDGELDGLLAAQKLAKFINDFFGSTSLSATVVNVLFLTA